MMKKSNEPSEIKFERKTWSLKGDKNLEMLEEMTNSLPTLEELVNSCPSEEILCEGGTSLGTGIGLFKIPEIMVQRARLSPGSFPEHFHKEHVWIICYKGEAVISIDGEMRNFGPKSWAYLEPNVPHSIEVKKDLFLIYITIPASEGFPNDG